MLTLATLAAPAIAMADEPAADTANLPGHIVNGDFEYPGWKTLIGSSSADWTSVTRDGASLNRDTANSWMRIPGFDADSFAWTSAFDSKDDYFADKCQQLDKKVKTASGAKIRIHVQGVDGNIFDRTWSADGRVD